MAGTFKKSNSGNGGANRGILPLPATFKEGNKIKLNAKYIILLILLVVFFGRTLVSRNDGKQASGVHLYPRPHARLSKHTIEVNSRYIVPAVEHVDTLLKLWPSKLVIQRNERNQLNRKMIEPVLHPLTYEDKSDPDEQAIIEKGQKDSLEANVKNTFKNLDKKVFKPKNKKNYPKVVIVSAVDFTRYQSASLAKLIQNRIDYAHEHGYGAYVRWAQDLAPALNSLDKFKDKEASKWIRIYCMRAAMFAFPEAEWFWYVDQDALIMNPSIDLEAYLLSKEALGPIMLRDQPILPPSGEIKTFKNSNPENVKLIVTQSNNKLDTSSFLVKNDFIGKAMLDVWGGSFFRDYNSFPYGPDSALTHILQWHPFYLSKIAIIPTRTISAKHSEVDLPKNEKGKSADPTHYDTGDLVALWSDENMKIEARESTLENYYKLLKGKAE